MHMNDLRGSLKVILGVALLGVVVTTGCRERADVEQLPDFAQSGEQNSISGAGSTFISPVMTNWIADYQKIHHETQVSYRAIGSGGGMDDFGKKFTEFAAS